MHMIIGKLNLYLEMKKIQLKLTLRNYMKLLFKKVVKKIIVKKIIIKKIINE